VARLLGYTGRTCSRGGEASGRGRVRASVGRRPGRAGFSTGGRPIQRVADGLCVREYRPVTSSLEIRRSPSSFRSPPQMPERSAPSRAASNSVEKKSGAPALACRPASRREFARPQRAPAGPSVVRAKNETALPERPSLPPLSLRRGRTKYGDQLQGSHSYRWRRPLEDPRRRIPTRWGGWRPGTSRRTRRGRPAR
jgi:hypothetical protein